MEELTAESMVYVNVTDETLGIQGVSQHNNVTIASAARQQVLCKPIVLREAPDVQHVVFQCVTRCCRMIVTRLGSTTTRR